MSKRDPSPLCLLRLKKDIKAVNDERPPGIFIYPDMKDIRVIHALIVGPKGTPYHGGFFYFFVKVPPDYPLNPPGVRLMTTGERTVQFNRNMDRYGTVCNSGFLALAAHNWSAANRLSCVLITLQSMMNEKPLFCEFGFKEKKAGDSDRYNRIIEHETLRVAVCDMLEMRTSDSRLLPQPLRDTMERQFLEFYDHYESVAKSRSHLTGKAMNDPMIGRHSFLNVKNTGQFGYSSILKRLQNIKARLEDKLGKDSETQ